MLLDNLLAAWIKNVDEAGQEGENQYSRNTCC